jgi:hypothetical protein
VELYLWAELLPDVAREVDVGRVAMGSVHFAYDSTEDDGAARGCVLVSHALTNTPAVTTLAPANSIRVDGREMIVMRSKAFAPLSWRAVREGKRAMEEEIKPAMMYPSIAAALDFQFQIAALVGQLRRDAHGLGVAVAEEPCRRHGHPGCTRTSYAS